MNKSNNLPKKHHYVPQFYLKKFLDNNRQELDVLRRDTENSFSIVQLSPKSICYEKHLYTISDKTINENDFNDIESLYAEVEGKINEITILLIKQDKQESLDEILEKISEFQHIMKLYISLMFWRNPHNNIYVENKIKDFLEYYDKSNNEQKKFALKDRAFIKYLQKQYLRKKKNSIFKFFQYFYLPIFIFNIYGDSKLKIKYLESGKYISSDNPVIMLGNIEENVNFQNIIFPITKNLLIFGENVDIASYDSDKINELMAKNANKYIYGDLDVLQNTKIFLEKAP